jgi:hypothetical protein
MENRSRPAPHGAGRVLFLTLLLAGAAFAAPADKPKLKVPNRIVFDPIRADEIVPGGPNVSAGSTSATLQQGGGRLTAALSPPDVGVLTPFIVRPIAELWSLKFTPNEPKPLGFVVSYRLTSPSGAVGALGHATQPGATVSASLLERPPRVTVQRNGMMDVVGDSELRIVTSSVAVSGQYVGDLLITVTYL